MSAADLTDRTARAISWQLDQSLPDLPAILEALPPPSSRPLPPGADTWDRASHSARLEQAAANDRANLLATWLHITAWHAAYVYSQFAMRSESLRDAGELYRGLDVQDELRRTVGELTKEVMT